MNHMNPVYLCAVIKNKNKFIPNFLYSIRICIGLERKVLKNKHDTIKLKIKYYYERT